MQTTYHANDRENRKIVYSKTTNEFKSKFQIDRVPFIKTKFYQDKKNLKMKNTIEEKEKKKKIFDSINLAIDSIASDRHLGSERNGKLFLTLCFTSRRIAFGAHVHI